MVAYQVLAKIEAGVYPPFPTILKRYHGKWLFIYNKNLIAEPHLLRSREEVLAFVSNLSDSAYVWVSSLDLQIPPYFSSLLLDLKWFS